MALMPRLDQDTLSTIATKIREGKCVLFLGAAVHAPPPKDSPYSYAEEVRPPLGGALSRQLAKRLLNSDKETAKQFRDECGARLGRLAHLIEAKLPDLFAELSKLLDVATPAEETDLRSQLLLACLPDLGRVALYYEVNFDRNQLVAEVAKAVEGDGPSMKQPSPVVHGLAALDFPIVITTNYDALLERAQTIAGKQPYPISYHRNETTSPRQPTGQYPGGLPTARKPLVYKIHGDIVQDRDSIVITDEDYIQFVLRMGDREPFDPIPSSVRFLLTYSSVLFIGYSLMDYNLRLLLKTLRRSLDEANRPPTYSVDRSPDPLIFEVWHERRKDVDFIVEDVWAFVPALYKEITGKDLPQ